MNIAVVALVLAIISFFGPIAVLISLFRRSDNEVAGGSRVLWAIVVIFIPFAWIVYFLVGRKSGVDRDW